MMKQTAALKVAINYNYCSDLLFINIVALVASAPNPDCCPICLDRCILKYKWIKIHISYTPTYNRTDHSPEKLTLFLCLDCKVSGKGLVFILFVQQGKTHWPLTKTEHSQCCHF